MKVNIRKSISRTINTGQYENIIIRCDLEIIEEVSSENELSIIQENLTKNILNDYEATEETVMKELELAKKSAFVKSSGNSESNFSDKKASLSPEDESEIFG